jgi:predicted deacetylase
MHALISIHDVMPSTLNRVSRITQDLTHLKSCNITMLVVPGHQWSREQLDVLREFEQQGYILCGHGWHHSSKKIRGIYHRLHSLLVSRNAAEHLALDEKEIRQLIDDCHQWFAKNNLGAPDLYVPPAWAMGKISPRQLEQTSFRFFENTSGFYDSSTGQQLYLPLIGFEADNMFQAGALKLWNAVNTLAGSEKKPVRISIHPSDRELLLADSLTSALRSVTNAVHYRSLF